MDQKVQTGIKKIIFASNSKNDIDNIHRGGEISNKYKIDDAIGKR